MFVGEVFGNFMQSTCVPQAPNASKSWIYHPHAVVVRSLLPSSPLPQRLAVALGEFHQTGMVIHGERALDALGAAVPTAWQGIWGALVVDGRRSLFQRQGHLDFPSLRLMLLEADLVVVSGDVDDGSPVILELDASGGGWEALADSVRARVIACVGPRPTQVPPGGLAWFAPSDLDGLVDHLLDHFERAVRDRPLWGVLETDASPADSLATSMAPAMFESCRRIAVRGARAKEWVRFGALALEPPGHSAWGKLGALLSLWDFDPCGAFVQVSLEAGPATDLDRLLLKRDPFQFATAFREPQSHLPQLGAVIWEPKSRSKVLQGLAAGLTCPQRVLVQTRTQLVDRSI